MKRNQKYVVQCVKTSDLLFCGYKHKAGEYVTFSGHGTKDINEAHIYTTNRGFLGNIEKKYYRFVPVKLIRINWF
jgi:hypothetical protein